MGYNLLLKVIKYEISNSNMYIMFLFRTKINQFLTKFTKNVSEQYHAAAVKIQKALNLTQYVVLVYNRTKRSNLQNDCTFLVDDKYKT